MPFGKLHQRQTSHRVAHQSHSFLKAFFFDVLQQVVSELVHQQSERFGAAVLFVTHDVNPIIDYVDRVLYLAQGRYSIGTADEVLQSDVLSALYGTEIDVVRNQGRVVVLGAHDHDHHEAEEWL
jgi:zinc/manganese transport system ATP-binding protein